MKPLNKERFYDFCNSYPGCERIDHLKVPPDAPERADYFLNDRRVIVEVKSLETDPNDKLAKFLIKSGVALREGTSVLSEVCKGHPDPKLEDKAWSVFTSSIARDMEKANSQIRETKQIFGVDEADGVLVIFHGKVESFNPDIILARVRQRLRKRNTNGGWAHDQLTHIVLVSEMHGLKVTDGSVAAAIIPLPNHGAVEKFGGRALIARLFDDWAKHLGRRNRTIPASALT